ncbi:hypothetical protein CDV36_011988 [Fusarium kuroshium]|uniref:Altered inheritance of mitochondria protein 6 n=1 Tax=Fusarium kuroshium TaxID=2010991 RepID=A0A3M2RSX9_9HYPO|nr:hypothetical protein CDV36_011988 [Fusarium kuroshium]
MLCGKDHENDTEYQPLRASSPDPSQADAEPTRRKRRVPGVRKVWKNLGWTVVIVTGLVGVTFSLVMFGIERYFVHAYESSGFSLADPFEDTENSTESVTRWVKRLSPHVSPAMVHSHNDYLRPRPLFSALSVGCVSVEADVWRNKDGNELLVGHHWWDLTPKRTLRSLYIDPLLQILDSMNAAPFGDIQGSHDRPAGVFANDPNRTLILSIDVKDDPVTTWPLVLEQLQPLRERNYLSRHQNISSSTTNQTFQYGPLTVVGTGNIVKRRDVNIGSDPERWRRYHDVFLDASLDLLRHPGYCKNDTYCLDVQENEFYTASVSLWRAIGTLMFGFSSSQLKTVRSQIQTAKRLNLKSRYWELPGWPISYRNYVWKILAREGIDLLNADDIVSAATQHWSSNAVNEMVWMCGVGSFLAGFSITLVLLGRRMIWRELSLR